MAKLLAKLWQNYVNIMKNYKNGNKMENERRRWIWTIIAALALSSILLLNYPAFLKLILSLL
jgi:hypothetical protein